MGVAKGTVAAGAARGGSEMALGARAEASAAMVELEVVGRGEAEEAVWAAMSSRLSYIQSPITLRGEGWGAG